MNKTSYLLLAIIVSSLTLGTAYALAPTLSFDEFCDRKTIDKRQTAADFICEIDIFQMKDDVTSLEDRVALIEAELFPEIETPEEIEPVPVIEIPSWIKNNAGWWADGSIDFDSFSQGVQYLITNGYLTGTVPDSYPDSLKSDAGDWADDVMDDDAFLEILQDWINSELSITVMTDKSSYSKGEHIVVSGTATNSNDALITLTVLDPLKAVIIIGQIYGEEDDTFKTKLSTTGSKWKDNGRYSIVASYGDPEKSSRVNFERTD